MDVTTLAPYVEAAAMGLGVGLEREWSNRRGEQQAAGSRTFAVLGLAGCVGETLGDAALAAGAIAVTGLLIVGYLRTAHADRGTTTEVAALATYLLGGLVRRDAELAIGLAVVMAALLAAKGPLHRLAREVVSDAEVEDALRFFVIAFVVLPVVPDRDLGPYGVLNPSKIWVLVVALTGIGWAGYVAVRALGARRGLLVAGFAGGFISATATTASLARLSRATPAVRASALSGALLASGATLVQLALVVGVANPSFLAAVGPALGAGLLLIAVEAGVRYVRRRGSEGAADAPPEAGRPGRPFALWPALLLAALLTAVTLAARWASDVAGSSGTVVAAALAGFADAHAPTLAVATLAAGGSVDLHTAVAASGLALATNTVSKCALAATAGGRAFGASFLALVLLPALAVGTGFVAWQFAG